jgi:hypothetical protein
MNTLRNGAAIAYRGDLFAKVTVDERAFARARRSRHQDVGLPDVLPYLLQLPFVVEVLDVQFHRFLASLFVPAFSPPRRASHLRLRGSVVFIVRILVDKK